MTSNDNLLKDYGEVIEKWEESGYIERVIDPDPTRPNLWYWAHFPVIKSEKDQSLMGQQNLEESASMIILGPVLPS
jgi:hypothetical protein